MTTTSTDLPKLGRYQVIDKIAAGGMAEVFLAKAVGDMGFQRLVAVKLIHANFTRDKEFVKMFIDEARIAMHLHHRNIVQVFDLDKVEGTYFIAMEYVRGVNLYDVYERIAAKNRWVEVPMALYMAAEVSKGLHFAHTRKGPDGRNLGIIHRDISPQNILLSFEGEVKITDFGIATAAERLHQTAAGIVKGKYAYMAPERLEEKPVDARVDVFSVGVLLYELLVGENPFAGPSAVETIENVLSKEVLAPSERGAPVSRRLDEICLKALAKDPEQRYRSGQELADALTEYAMELTYARKDMASGDSAIANLLQELFPEKANRQPGTNSSPEEIQLPGVDDVNLGSVLVQDTPRDPDTHKDPHETADDLDVVAGGLSDDSEEEAPAGDLDAPTVLRMTPVTAAPDVDSYDEDEAGMATIAADGSSDWALQTLNSADKDSYTADPTVPTPAISRSSLGQAVPVPSDVKDTALPGALQAPPAPVLSAPPISLSNVASGNPGATPQQSIHPTESSEQFVFPVNGTEAQRAQASHPGRAAPSAYGAPKKKSRLNLIAAVTIALAVALAAGAFWVLQNSETALPEVPISVESTPSGAEIFINQAKHSGLTPAQLSVLADQPLHLELKKEGFKPISKDLTPKAGEAVRISETLTALTGSLVIIPTPESAQVEVNGKVLGTGKQRAGELPLKQVIKIKISAEGYQPLESTVTLDKPQGEQILPLKLQKDTNSPNTAAPKFRQMLLKAPYGSWARVFFKNKYLGDTPVKVRLPVGTHKIRVNNPGTRLDKEIEISVPAQGKDEIQLAF